MKRLGFYWRRKGVRLATITGGHEFTRAAGPIFFVIPSRLEPRLRGEHLRGICSFPVLPQAVLWETHPPSRKSKNGRAAALPYST